MPGIARTSITRQVAESCSALAASRELISEHALHAFARDLPLDRLTADRPAVGYPIRFSSGRAELNFLAAVQLLDFGSGFNALLPRGCQETVQFGLLGMHISGKEFTAQTLRELTLLDVSSFFGIQTHREEQLQPGISISRPGPLKPFAEQLLGALNEAGQQLQQLGCRDFADLLSSAAGAEADSGGLPAAAAVERLRALPGFDDAHQMEGTQVLLMRKAVNLAADLARRFAGPEQAVEGLSFAADPALPGDSGMQVLAALLDAGVLTPPGDLAAKAASQQELSSDEAALLRAGAVAAILQLSQATGATQRQINDHLLGVCRQKDLPLPRHTGSLHV